MHALVRRRTQEKELRMAGDWLGTRQQMEGCGLLFMGSTGAAARAGYLTPRGCEKAGAPVTEAELTHPEFFAMMADCYSDLCLRNVGGTRRRPCLPVFYRDMDGETLL